MKRPLLFLFLCVPFMSVAQDLTGIWRGHFVQSGTMSVIEKLYGVEDRYKFEVQLDQRDKYFKGVTYSYKTTVFYGKASCKGTVNNGSGKVLLNEMEIVEVRMAQGSDACIMFLQLTYTRNGEEEFMEGTYTSMNIRDSSNCGRGTVFLRKVPTSDFYKEPFLVRREEEAALKKKTPPAVVKTNPNPPAKKPATTSTDNSTTKKPTTQPNTNTTAKTTTKKPDVKPPVKKPDTAPDKDVAKSNPNNTVVKPAKVDSVKAPEKKITTAPTPKVLANRQNELVKTIVVGSTEVTVDLYDNGTIDNDTVSVYLDKKLVVSKQRLTERAITVKLKLDENNDYHELVMVAENLGEIPPNTSLMVVKAGDKQYEVRITSNEQKNAVVIFKYEKPG
ncbi:MAG TPA: hypothetical protein VD993_02850 [Chitinophagaceae bacterium]|nr:hypothetical protein [Chitinophagaceae bacterium]